MRTKKGIFYLKTYLFYLLLLESNPRPSETTTIDLCRLIIKNNILLYEIGIPIDGKQQQHLWISIYIVIVINVWPAAGRHRWRRLHT